MFHKKKLANDNFYHKQYQRKNYKSHTNRMSVARLDKGEM